MATLCAHCGESFEAERKSARFCGPTCRKRASRVTGARSSTAPPPPGQDLPASDFEIATRAELERLGKADSMLGLQVLIVARRMSNGTETGSALATLSKEHSRLMAALTAGEKSADPVDEVGRRREEKRARATAR